jgi:hypothetical protein
VCVPLAKSRSADGLECPYTDASDAVDIAIGRIADRQRGVISTQEDTMAVRPAAGTT